MFLQDTGSREHREAQVLAQLPFQVNILVWQSFLHLQNFYVCWLLGPRGHSAEGCLYETYTTSIQGPVWR